jgi:transcriptional regulator with XRE-family HTH domain
MESITDCLATNVRKLRKEKGLTQGELAKKSQISLVFLQGIETKRKWVSPDTAKSLAKALGVKEADLFKDCFKQIKTTKKKIKIKNLRLDHIPEDILFSLTTTCLASTWKWESIRWIIQGFERDN